MEVPDDDQTSSQTEISVEPQNDDETSSKDTLNRDDHVAMNVLNTTALEVNSADEIRQAIKAVLSGKAPQISNSTDSATLPAENTSEEPQVGIPQEYKPESGDQLVVIKNVSTRKRRGRPQEAGPSKRAKRAKTAEDFYVGKLSNVVNYPRFKRRPN